MGPGPVRADAARPARRLSRRVLWWGVRLGGLALLAGLALVWLAPGRVLPPVARFLDVSEAPRAVDYVLVLNGDPDTRPFAAAALFKAGLARGVLLSPQRRTLESASVQDGELLSELELTRRVLRARGVPSAAVEILPTEIAGTFDEARALAAFLKEKPDATVAVVTNSFHTRRARFIFGKVMGEHAAQVCFVGVPRDRADEAAWWRTECGCNVYLSEYGKLLYYRLRY